ncbi:hypothetical protein [uncultured Roseovarius sp.]|uniref:hypothetical protein n=1 Tax=uncultured Roseovarius sp. TaxID=293344 RepID=UPI00262D61A1|nr:hypothetical protein [uncultured Roseovarius sp.]
MVLRKINGCFLLVLTALVATPAEAIVDRIAECSVKNSDIAINLENKKVRLSQGAKLKLKFRHFGSNCMPVFITVPSGEQIVACSGFVIGQAKKGPKDVVTLGVKSAVWTHILSQNPERKIEISLDCLDLKLF